MKHVLMVSLVICVWLGFLCGFLFDFSGVMLLSVGILILGFIFTVKSFWIREVLSICLLLLIFYSIPLASMSFGITVKNQAEIPITLYVVDLQKDKTNRIPFPSREEKYIGLAHGEDLNTISKNNYFILALDSKGKVRLQEKINIGEFSKSGRKDILIK